MLGGSPASPRPRGWKRPPNDGSDGTRTASSGVTALSRCRPCTWRCTCCSRSISDGCGVPLYVHPWEFPLVRADDGRLRMMAHNASRFSAFVPTQLREALELSARALDRSLSAELSLRDPFLCLGQPSRAGRAQPCPGGRADRVQGTIVSVVSITGEMVARRPWPVPGSLRPRPARPAE